LAADGDISKLVAMKIGELSTVADSGRTGPEPDQPIAEPTLGQVETTHYELDGVIASGGAGVVLEARDRRLRRRVAVKQMLRFDPRLQARFEREALLTARLQHPGIVPIYEAGRWPSGESFYAMRLIEGRPLSEVIAACRTLDERLALVPRVVAISEAVAYAHTERVIHRDLKPQNIVIGPFGEVVVIDWGLAKDLAAGPEPTVVSETGAISGGETVVGAVIGTPAYMPPEQARGEQVDERADVYALGATLYQVLTGTPPFSATSNAENLDRLLAAPPRPVEERQPGVPRDLAALIAKAMARDPADRYASAGELAEELRRFVTGQLVQAHHYPRAVLVRRAVRRHPLALATGVFTLVLLVAGALALRRIVAEKSAAEDRGRELLLGQARALLQTDPTASVALLKRYPDRPDDSELVRAIALDAESRGVARRLLAGHTKEVRDVAIAPDGSEVASVAEDGALYLWSTATGAGQRIVSTRSPMTGVVYDPTGRTLAASYGTHPGVLVWDRETRRARRIDLESDLYPLAFSPDGQTLAGADVGGRIFLWPMPDGAPRTLLHGDGVWMSDVLFSPDGRLLLSVGEDAAARLWPLAGGEPRALPLDGQGWCGAFSRDGGSIAIGQENGNVRVFSVTDPSAPPRVFRAAAGGVEFVQFSPDGARLAWVGQDRDAHVVELASGEVRALHGHEDSLSALGFLADGSLVTASSDATLRHWDLGSGISAVLRGHADHVRAMAVDPARRLIVSGGADRALRLWQLPPPPRTFAVPGREEGSLRWSPDNGVLYADRTGGGLAIADVDSGRVRLLETSRKSARMVGDPTGKVVAYRDMKRKVLLVDVATGAERALPETLNLVGVGFEFSADGRTLAFPDWTGLDLVDVTSLTVRQLAYPSGRIDEEGQKVRRIQFSSDGRRVLATRGENLGCQIDLWDLPTGAGRIVAPPVSGEGAVVVGNADLTALAAGAAEAVWLRDPDRGGWRRLLDATGAVGPIAFSRDGSRLAAADEDGHLWVWRVTDGALLHELIGHQSAVRRIEFSADGRRLVSAGRDGATRLWDVATGQELRALRAHDGREVEWAGFRGDAVVTVGRDGTIRVWPPVEREPGPVEPLLDRLTSAGPDGP
jgi:WD40 repeat protein/tRNA A-37 threonylcarbamoyl transferase component Bud32